MKAFGEESLSSVLRVALEVFWYLVLFSLGLWVLGVIMAALGNPANLRIDVPLSFRLDPAIHAISSETIDIEGAGLLETKGTLGLRTGNRGLVFGYVALVGHWIALLLAVLYQFRILLRTLAAGKPFASENASRVRMIGYLIIGIELLRAILFLVISSIAKANLHVAGLVIESPFRPNLGLLLAGGAVLLIAEVFRQASAMHEEQALTV
jgi:hypothetical protein